MKKMTSKNWVFGYTTALSFLAMSLFASCSSSHRFTGAMDSTSHAGASSKDGATYVEAYFEYTGPQARWAGPPTLLLHVTALNSGSAKVTWSSPTVTIGSKTVANRILAPQSRLPAQAKELSLTVAREDLMEVARSLKADQSTFSACMAPVRIRLIRTDGGTYEKTICRDQQSSWPKSVGGAVGDFMKTAFLQDSLHPGMKDGSTVAVH